MQQQNKLDARDASGAILGTLGRTAEGALIFGRYTAVHRRVLPAFAGEAALLSERIARLQASGMRAHRQRLARRLVAELEELPRFTVGEYDAPNLVTDVGAQLLLNTILAGSAFTATTIVGLKGSGAAAVGDTQASHAGWLEVGLANAPAYTAPRKTFAWSAASGSGAGSRTKNSTGTFTFAFTSAGTVDGAFLNLNGSTTIDNTTGTLFSAGTFTGGSKVVAISDTLTVTYSLAI